MTHMLSRYLAAKLETDAVLPAEDSGRDQVGFDFTYLTTICKPCRICSLLAVRARNE